MSDKQTAELEAIRPEVAGMRWLLWVMVLSMPGVAAGLSGLLMPALVLLALGLGIGVVVLIGMGLYQLATMLERCLRWCGVPLGGHSDRFYDGLAVVLAVALIVGMALLSSSAHTPPRAPLPAVSAPQSDADYAADTLARLRQRLPR